MAEHENSDHRSGYCPVYDIECPSGVEAAEACDARFKADYNPLLSYRDADIEHCAIYRKQQQENKQSNREDMDK